MARVKCPRFGCRSTNCVPISQGKKYKTGKGLFGGAVGAVALGPVGALAGAATGFNGKREVTFMCQSCGKTFKVKM